MLIVNTFKAFPLWICKEFDAPKKWMKNLFWNESYVCIAILALFLTSKNHIIVTAFTTIYKIRTAKMATTWKIRNKTQHCVHHRSPNSNKMWWEAWFAVCMYDIITTYIFPEALWMVVKAPLKFLYSLFMIFVIFLVFFLVLVLIFNCGFDSR